jgi:hypothetical protein
MTQTLKCFRKQLPTVRIGEAVRDCGSRWPEIAAGVFWLPVLHY